MQDYELVEDTLGKAYDARLLRRLLRYLRPHSRLFLLAALFLFATTSLELLIPYVLKTAIDNYLAVLHVRFTGPPHFLTHFAAQIPTALQPTPSNLLIPQRIADRSDSPLHTPLATNLVRDPVLYHVLPAAAATGNLGVIQGKVWLLPHTARARVGPVALLRARRAQFLHVSFLALLLLAIITAKLGTEFAHALLLQIAGQRAMLDLRRHLFSHLTSLPVSYFDRTPVGRLVTRVTNDVEAINEVFSSVLVGMAKDLLYFSGATVILFLLNARLALIALALLPVFVIIAFVFKQRARSVYRTVRRQLSLLNARLNEDLSGVTIIQIFRQYTRRLREFADINAAYFRANMDELVIFGIFRPLVDSLRSIAIACLLVYGGWSIIGGLLTLGVLIAFMQYLSEMYRPIIEISQQYTAMQSAMAAAERIFSLLDEQPEPRTLSVTSSTPAPRGHLVFQNVSFSYPNGPPVLKNISFAVSPGRSIAIVGPTGAGKTSILNLICRFYDPTLGSILLDGRDLRSWPLDHLRRHLAIVLQDTFVFSRSVADNIRLARQELSHDDVVAAAQLVQARPFIEALPHQFDERMMERGATLSTGQKQLLCFARALAHNPRILLLDEATSNVDPPTELLIQQAIETLMRGRTSIIVAHRLSTIKRADEILVLDQGHILERGSHSELLARRGLYYNLYCLQFCHQADAPPTS
ncbi:MAG: ABC transporter ATP-binding protein/permease [bacterium]|nr:ABC transporter ATP-binding protein/permease [bacterium]